MLPPRLYRPTARPQQLPLLRLTVVEHSVIAVTVGHLVIRMLSRVPRRLIGLRVLPQTSLPILRGHAVIAVAVSHGVITHFFPIPLQVILNSQLGVQLGVPRVTARLFVSVSVTVGKGIGRAQIELLSTRPSPRDPSPGNAVNRAIVFTVAIRVLLVHLHAPLRIRKLLRLVRYDARLEARVVHQYVTVQHVLVQIDPIPRPMIPPPYLHPSPLRLVLLVYPSSSLACRVGVVHVYLYRAEDVGPSLDVTGGWWRGRDQGRGLVQ